VYSQITLTRPTYKPFRRVDAAPENRRDKAQEPLTRHSLGSRPSDLSAPPTPQTSSVQAVGIALRT